MLTGRALLLDMDGTLVDSHAVVERCWSRWAREKGLDPAAVLATGVLAAAGLAGRGRSAPAGGEHTCRRDAQHRNQKFVHDRSFDVRIRRCQDGSTPDRVGI